MCDICTDFSELLNSYHDKVNKLDGGDLPLLRKKEIDQVFTFIQNWIQRQCFCCFRESKNYEKFNLITQSIILLVVKQLKAYKGQDVIDSQHCLSDDISKTSKNNKSEVTIVEITDEKENTDEETVRDKDGKETSKEDSKSKSIEEEKRDVWTIQDMEKLCHFLSKVFLLNFPLYAAHKQSLQTKMEQLTQQEASVLSNYCDVNDLEIPIHLLQNVCLLCRSGGVQAMTACFEYQSLPLPVAHSIIAVVCNLKLWLNFRTTIQLFIPLRSKVLRYMCNMTDKDLRSQGIKGMADFMWSAVKDPMDSPVQFDRDGLNLAFKYFTSSTLTMRLAGISQINSHINMFNEMCNSENIMEVESVGQSLATWLIDNNIICHIFGPNLHVEVIKQSHIILSFLAMECKITNEHIDTIWQAAQLKHCSKQVHDLLPPLIKNLEAGPVLHLYHLLCQMEPKDHSEQSLYLASAIIKFLWSSNGSYTGLGEPPSGFVCLTGYAKTAPRQMSSSDNTNSEGDTSEGHKSDSEGSDGPTPRKRQKQRKALGEEDSSDDSIKVEDLEDEDEATAAKRQGMKGSLPLTRGTKQKIAERRYQEISKHQLDPKHVRPNIKLKKVNVGPTKDQLDSLKKLKFHRQQKVIRDKLKAMDQDKDENSNSVKIVECSEEEEEDEEDEEEDEESESEEEGVMLAGRISLDPEVVKVVTDQEVPNLMLRQGSDYIQLVSRDSPDCGQTTAVMTELASLVQNAPHCRPFIATSFQPNPHEMMEEILSVEDGDADGSLSSRMSNKSEKNMADFDGEESGCDEELAQFTARAQAQQLGQMSRLHTNKVALHLAPILSLEHACKPGNTLLWDLLQDDKIDQLGEGLALEAEKVLCNLLCFSTDKLIRMKFIEGCLENLAKNWSVVVSLRLLPKLFASFQHFRSGGMDTQHVTLWALKEHAMMERFFENLRVQRSAGPLPLTHVQVRLQFLTHIYSPLGHPDYIRLSVEELDTLWQCLAGDTECSDELFSWLLRQARSKDQHALRPETLRHLYSRKLPTLPPETISMTALELYQQLCNMAPHLDSPDMDYLWKIALRANNTDVSMAAIQYLNHYYMGRQLQQEAQFVCQCMANLTAATQDLATHEEASLLCIQRALLLLNTHLDTFKRRYAYHLRRWTIEGHSLASHVTGERDKGSVLKIMVQPAGVQDKVGLELLSTDYVAELRAEVTVWWESLHKSTPYNDGPIRIITQGQELTTEFDEKTLGEIGFKDMQMVYISVGASRQKKRGDSNDTPSVLPPPPRECSPTLLLLLPNYFEQLFKLMQTLSAMKIAVKGGHHIPHTKAQVLSRRVWDILTLLPTSPTLLDGFQRLDCESKLQQLLDPASPQKLMYSLYIVESLSRSSSVQHKSPVPDDENQNDIPWSEKFVQNGGLRHLFDIFMSGVLQVSGGSEWQQDCLSCLLKLLCQLGMSPTVDDSVTSKNKRKRCAKTDKLVIPKLSQPMLQLMKMETVIPRLTSILYEASMPRDPNHYKTGFWGRAQVVQYAMALIVSWANTVSGVREALYAEDHFLTWLRRLVLEEPEPCVRREVCMALYRLAAPPHAPAILTHLLGVLDKAEEMRPAKQEGLHLQPLHEDGKEPYGPACRDYFWLLCRLVDSLTPDDISKEVIDLENLARRVYQSIIQREYLETRHNTLADDGLIGLLNLMSNILKHNPSFKTEKEGQDLLNEVFEFLFALPDPSNRHFPKCKSQAARSSAYDLLAELVKGAKENYKVLHEKLLAQHKPGPHSPYPWDYWPHEDGRSACGYVGLTNLGATCYMASCMQHLYMMPQARAEILRARCDQASPKHQLTLRELQRMFAYLLESERKAYNPRSFCKVYTMDHQPLNTGEQKDMAEFFIDVVSKLEEMTPELKELVKTLFGGVISNNVVSLDCDHVSRTLEEFYTVRCQVADMRNLYESLDEVTVKDTLEGDNMYTCSQCGKKVRAEKRACFKTLPNVLCFNTMRYTFNMVTMLKEKVNTHFSFPLRLDMSGYVEKHLMPQQYQEEKDQESREQDSAEKDKEKEEGELSYEYDLIGVTVHTGTADGGHYYSFIRDRMRDKWFLFNDAEVKPFDPKQIAAECFGGEMTSKTYDSVTDKFMDLSFEKTNSAYMLFYERTGGQRDGGEGGSRGEEAVSPTTTAPPPITLSKELEDWIWQDNMHFLRDKNIFEHNYVQFMWQICGYVPQTLDSPQEVIEIAAQLSTTFFIETFIHAKEKPTMVQWVELLTKQFNMSQEACEWFLQHMAHNNWWPVQILIKCPNQMVRQMFQRLCQHVIQLLRPTHTPLFLKMDSDDEGMEECDPDKIGYLSCVTMFIRMLLSLMEHGAKPHLKHLTEYFALLYEFSKMGEDESQFLISIHAISTMVNFYLGQKSHDYVEVVSEEEEEEEVVPLPTDKYKPQSLDKMITLVALLVEKSRGPPPDNSLRLSSIDYSVIAGSKGYPFLFQQIKDCINLHQTRNLIFSLCRYNDRLANHIVAMIFSAIHKFSEMCQPFFKLLTLLVEAGPPGLPCFTDLVISRLLEVMEVTPQSALDWLAVQVPRNKVAHAWVMAGLDSWLHHYLLAHNNQRVRSAAAYLLVALVPSTQFRQCYRTARPHKEVSLAPDAQGVLHQVYTVLLRLLKGARLYTDISQHGSTKLSAYFTLLNYFAISRTEKLMFGPYLLDLWQLFHPKLSEPGIPVHHNKQALLMFWYHVSTDCPENVQLILQNAHITKNIAFNYILADHEEQEVVLFNRAMLPAYYGLLRLCCQQSRTFTRQLATHQNLTWAFKNITPHPTQYAMAVDELFKLMALFAAKYPDSTEHEVLEINTFRKQTLQLYLQFLDGRSSWATLISAFRILVENDQDRHFVLYNGGLQMCFESFHTLHVMYHEATACHVTGDLLELLSILVDLVKCLRTNLEVNDVRGIFLACKDWMDILRKLVTLLNTYNSNDMRNLCIDLLKELVLLMPCDVLGVLVPVLSHCHAAFQDNNNAMPMGPYFPRQGHKLPALGLKVAARPLRPMVQMAVPHNQIDVAKGVDPEYDQALNQFYAPYHSFIDVMCRLAINHNCMTENLVNLSAMVGFEAVPLHFTFFPKLWLDISQAQNVDRKYITMLTNSSCFADYVESVLLDERLSLNDNIIYNFLDTYFPKVAPQVLSDHTCQLMETLVHSLGKTVASGLSLGTAAYKLHGDLRALSLVYSVELPVVPPPELPSILNKLLAKINQETEESPSKKRKIEVESSESKEPKIEEKAEQSSKDEEAKASCSKDKDSSVTSEDSSSSHSHVDWLERLRVTVTSLIAALQQKHAHEETT